VNLCSVIANLQLKMGYKVVSAANLRGLQELSHFAYELTNLEPHKRQAYVGQSAFAHKGGVHVAAVQRNPLTYEHIDPAVVGNQQRVLVSDLSGRANILYKAKQFGVDLDTLDPHVRQLVKEVKDLELAGYQFEGADASLELRMHRVLTGGRRYFELIQFRVVDEKGYMRLRARHERRRAAARRRSLPRPRRRRSRGCLGRSGGGGPLQGAVAGNERRPAA
jgi:2-isopropylmalate synthase